MDPEAMNLYERGQFELADGQYQTALDYFNRALERSPGAREALLGKGRALMELKRYDQAEATFKELLTGSREDRLAASIELAELYTETKRYPLAVEFYSLALLLEPDRPNLYVGRGGVYLEMGQYDEAVADFRKVADIDPDLGAFSEYHLALASYYPGRYDRALEHLDRAAALDPDPSLAKHINQFQERVAEEKKANKAWRVTADTYVQYDDNVPLEPLDGWGVGNIAAPTSDKEDWGIGLDAHAAYNIINLRRHKVGLDYTFRGLWYTELTESNVTSHAVGAYYNYARNPLYMRFRIESAYFNAAGDDRMVMNSFYPSLAAVWGKNDRTEFSGQVAFKSMMDDTDDVWRWVGGLIHYHTFWRPPGDALPWTGRLGFQIENETPLGETGAKYVLYEASTGLSLSMPWRLESDLRLAYAWVNFDYNPLIDPNQTRRDQRLRITIGVGRPITDYLRLRLSWDHTYNNSNLNTLIGGNMIDLYHYRRNVFTLMLTGRF
jgi:tetratricopeptide (TPR) repeat protein